MRRHASRRLDLSRNYGVIVIYPRRNERGFCHIKEGEQMKIAVGFLMGVLATLVVLMIVFCIRTEKKYPEILAYYQKAKEQEQRNASHRETFSWGD